MIGVALRACVVVFLLGCASHKQAEQWPKHRLVEAVFENSIEHRYRSKLVRAAELIDDMEIDRQWSVSGIGKLAYTTDRAKDGKRSLRLRTPMRDEGHIKANHKDGAFVANQPASTTAKLEFDKPRDWSRFNRISLWLYVHPTPVQGYSLRMSFRCEGAPTGPREPVPTHVVHDFKAGEWNHIVWEIPDHYRDKVTGLAMNVPLRGHDFGEEGIATLDFDRIEIQRVDPEPYEGWEVAPGKIAFHHVGYRPSDQKLAFVDGAAGERFELMDADSGESVAGFPAKTVRNKRGRFQVLDFTPFRKPGKYMLRTGSLTSRTFAISEDLWFGTIEKAVNFFYSERCGYDVPGIHRVCHQDWKCVHEGQTRIINGGWHDAGDLSQGSHRTGASVYAMLHVYEQLRQRDVRPELRDRVLEEARWGLDWLLKTRFGKGYRVTWALGRFFTDNKLGTVDDLKAPAQHVAYENFLFSAVGAYASRVLKELDSRRAGESLRAAVEDYRATMEKRPEWSEATREEAALGALASTELYRATGDPAYAAQAARFGRLLIECQEQRFVEGIPVTGYFYTSTKRQRIVHDFHGSWEESSLLALRALCDTFPGHADWMAWYGGALLHSEYFFRQGTAISEPYRLIPNSVWRRSEVESMKPTRVGRGFSREAILAQFHEGTRLSGNHRLRAFPIYPDNGMRGNTAVHMSGTLALTAAAQLRNQPAIGDLVQRQLQWVFGGNPFSQSLMYGEGYDFQPLFAYLQRNMVGALPVGMDALRNDAPYWPSTNHATFKEIWVVPVGRFLWNMAYAAMPARVSGSGTTGAEFHERGAGARFKVPPGRFSINLPPGDYEVAYGGATKRLALLAGGRYELALDPRRAIDMELSAHRTAERVRITATVRGAGTHKLALRAFNGSVDAPETVVDLTPGVERQVTWIMKVRAADKPWAAVTIPDGDMNGRKEVFGTMMELPRIE